MSQFFASGGQSIGVLATASVLRVNIQDFRIDRLDLLAVQGTLKSLLQHHSSKASILQHSAFFTVQLLHPYMTTGKASWLNKWIELNTESVAQKECYTCLKMQREMFNLQV